MALSWTVHRTVHHHFWSITCCGISNIRTTLKLPNSSKNATWPPNDAFSYLQIGLSWGNKVITAKILLFFYPNGGTSWPSWQRLCPPDTTYPKQLSHPIPLTLPQQLVCSANLHPIIDNKKDQAGKPDSGEQHSKIIKNKIIWSRIYVHSCLPALLIHIS